MGKKRYSKMSEIEQERARKKRKFQELIATPFDLTNQGQQAELKKYLDKFELSANQWYLFDAMNSGLITGTVGYVLSNFLPIPDFAKYLLSICIYLGVTGHILKSFSTNDFYDQLAEMKDIYTWCVKGGASRQRLDVVLAQPEIQRLIKLIAPFCSDDFMLAWPKESTSAEPKGVVSSIGSYIYDTVTSFSFFPAPTKPVVDVSRIRDLKVAVEERHFDLGVYKGLQQSMEYFITNTDFRSLMAAKTIESLKSVRDMLPEAVGSLVTPRGQ